MSEASVVTLSWPEKAALLLLSFPSEASARLISRLSPREAEALAVQFARVREMDEATRAGVLEDFKRAAKDGAPIGPLGPPTSEPPTIAARPAASEAETPADAEDSSIRPYDFAGLPRLPRASRPEPGTSDASRLSLLCDLPLRCRAELVALPLSLDELRGLSVGDVLLLGPAAQARTQLVAGGRCRFSCRLLTDGKRRAVEVLPEAAGGERR